MKRSMEDKDPSQQQEEKKEQPESQGQANRPAETKPTEAEKQAEYYKDLFPRQAARCWVGVCLPAIFALFPGYWDKPFVTMKQPC